MRVIALSAALEEGIPVRPGFLFLDGSRISAIMRSQPALSRGYMFRGKYPQSSVVHRGFDPPENFDEGRPAAPGRTGEEAVYLKSLVDSRARVTVVLKTGERFSGRIRYYDLHCFSLGQGGGAPKLFLRKENIQSIVKE